jgi:hypothetical protein
MQTFQCRKSSAQKRVFALPSISVCQQSWHTETARGRHGARWLAYAAALRKILTDFV